MAANSFINQYKTSNIAIKLIVINVVVYLIFNLLPWIVQMDNSVLTRYFVLPTELSRLVTQPWSILTYAFLHGGFLHILFNMLFLYVFSKFVLNLFTEKRFLTIYLLGGIFGGLTYIIAYHLFPAFEGNGILLGASAAVNAIIIFIATYSPNTPIRFFVFNLKLWHIAAFVVLRDLLTLESSSNAGGLISHLGGAAFGYMYAMQLAKGNDIGLWFEKIMDTVASWFSSKPKTKKAKMHTVHRKTKKTTTKSTKTRQRPVTKSEQQQQIDAILDKISKSGYDSLSKAEKDFLFKAGKDN
ncbi:rhomboid family intramembrane serine protease [Dokdonia pacifica]|uniref:Membrane associated serine protease, rhomboid family n=1 Tax=Dokdonia pacifica TaxID=1627892 RepID=A0A239E8Y3_9FLAO|nr:rhomboid family intramembrane serine protease [Dokdonia pacifica]GGG27606.1 rhomboid family intramembrane serine protease [Dokdonia pacifica]SNS41086.1 Membrane associated serine protease, rhomboid family [Dokdonia pacifica]